MRRLAWVTDIHLNFVKRDRVEALCADIVAQGADTVLVGGDVGEARSIVGYLEDLASLTALPVYAVLGNHDFYRGSIRGVRHELRALCARDPRVQWLNDVGVVELTPETALVGCDGWGDARLGNGVRSPVALNDFVHIEELAFLSLHDRGVRLAALGDEAAAHVRAHMPAALARYAHVVFLTHVPPFRDACWHDGKISDDDWLPYFTCGAVGEALREAAGAYPDRRVTVLCGHTHGHGRATILPNLVAFTGGAQYGAPAPQASLDVA